MPSCAPIQTWRCAAGRALNFGFFGSRESIGPSINGKLSEYHAAVGLADLDGWPEKRQGFIAAAEAYRAEAKAARLGQRIIAETANANPYALFLADDAAFARRAEAALQAGVADTRKWYGTGLHQQPEFATCPRGALDVTDDIAPRLIGLPLSCDLTRGEIRRIVTTIAAAT